MKKCLLFFSLLLFLSSCFDGWKKDAFEDESESVKNAVPFNQQKEKIPPPDRDVIFMNFEPVYSVLEGETLNIPVRYSIGHPNVKFQQIVIQDSDEFSGLTYDEKNQNISITPLEEFVDISSKYKLQTVEVSLFAEYEGIVLESVAKINIMVVPRMHNRGVLSEILKTVDFPSKTSPGKEYQFKVYVHGSTEQPPSLQIFNRNKYSQVRGGDSGNGGARYFSVKYPPSNGFGDEELLERCGCSDKSTREGLDIWEFDVTLNLPENMRLFKDKDTYGIDFVAYSIYGVPSKTLNQILNVSPETAPEPAFIGEPVVRFVRGEWNSHTFLVVNTSGISKVSARCVSPVGSTCQCQENARHYSSCILKWKPEETGGFEVEVHKVGQIFDNFQLADESVVKESFRVTVVESEQPVSRPNSEIPSVTGRPGDRFDTDPKPVGERLPVTTGMGEGTSGSHGKDEGGVDGSSQPGIGPEQSRPVVNEPADIVVDTGPEPITH